MPQRSPIIFCSPTQVSADIPQVALIGDARAGRATSIARLFARYGLDLCFVAAGATIPASFWGCPEAGLRGTRLFVRPDTPLSSVLHEACHFLCMDEVRRQRLDTNAGGDDLEECAVCYLSLLLADLVPGYNRLALLGDMDRWGYTFRLGSAAAWFASDALDARTWLHARGWVDRAGKLIALR